MPLKGLLRSCGRAPWSDEDPCASGARFDAILRSSSCMVMSESCMMRSEPCMLKGDISRCRCTGCVKVLSGSECRYEHTKQTICCYECLSSGESVLKSVMLANVLDALELMQLLQVSRVAEGKQNNREKDRARRASCCFCRRNQKKPQSPY